MKRVTLLRHAKSSWDDPVDKDLDRPLNEKGYRAAVTVGRHLRQQDRSWDYVVASPAVRVRETLDGLYEGLGRTLEPVFEKGIYMAHVDTLIELIRGTDDDAASLLMVGHNPGLEDVVFELSAKDDAPLRQEVEVKYPTATVCDLSFDVERWADIETGSGEITAFIRPRDLDPDLGPDG